jgi:pimeloyl-ACP methyl ester carboxylesterase
MSAGRRRPARLRVPRPARLVAVVTLALLTTVLTAACSGAKASPPAPAAASTQAATPAPPTTLAGYYAQRLDWQPCDNGFQCARLLVPFDYTHPDGHRFSLPVIKLPATDPSRRIGALVVNPGGPGGSGVQYALGARGEIPAAVRARFDIVGFDPRGVGASEPALTCMTGPELDQFFATDDAPANAAQLAAVVRQGKLYAARCEQRSGALLPYVGTQNAARDLDVLRSALGESQLTYLGKSYGTYLGAWYAQLFPSHVRALVLDGAVDPDTPSLADDITQAQGFQVAFRSFAAWCLASAPCPLQAPSSTGSAAVNAGVAKTQALITRANATPLGELGDGQIADGAMLVNGITAALYSTSFWPDLKIGLTDAFAGNGTVLVELANLLYQRNPNGTYTNLADADTAISCLDRPWPRSVAAFKAAAAEASRVAPLFGAPIVWGSLACAYWPVPSYPLPRIRAVGGQGSRPILVVGTLRDPATPYRQAQALAADLASGVLLGWNGDGHTAYGEGSACVDTIVNDYLIDLAVPRSGRVCP